MFGAPLVACLRSNRRPLTRELHETKAFYLIASIIYVGSLAATILYLQLEKMFVVI